jgi:hypothetical protein
MTEILVSLIDKLLWVAFAFSLLGTLRIAFMFLRQLLRKNPQQLVLKKNELIALGAYLAVIIMCIFTGIRL